MKIGSVELDEKRAFLAPMAGVADMAFRETCKAFGAGFVTGEMVSGKGLTMSDRKSRDLLLLSNAERPAAVQIFGSDPLIMAQSAEKCLEFSPDIIDINMGCPAPKIVGGGSGSALLKDPARIGEIVSAVVKAVNVPVTAKIRIGWDKDSINAVETAKICEHSGASALTVHGRTRCQMYSPPVYTDVIAEVVRAVNIPVIANGDIENGPTAADMIEKTNCAAVAVGRGALGRPWVFSQIEAYLKHGVLLPEPPVQERMRVMVRHIELLCSYKGERVGIREARKHVSWYMKGFRGASKFRREAGMLETIDDVKKLAFNVIKENTEE